MSILSFTFKLFTHNQCTSRFQSFLTHYYKKLLKSQTRTARSLSFLHGISWNLEYITRNCQDDNYLQEVRETELYSKKSANISFWVQNQPNSKTGCSESILQTKDNIFIFLLLYPILITMTNHNPINVVFKAYIGKH